MQYEFTIAEDEDYRLAQFNRVRRYRKYSYLAKSRSGIKTLFLYGGYFLYLYLILKLAPNIYEWFYGLPFFVGRESSARVLGLAFWIGLLVAGLFLTIWLTRRICYKSVASGSDFKVRFTNRGLEIQNSYSESLYYWTAIEFMKRDDKGLFVQVPMGGIWIADRYFKDEGEINGLYADIYNHLTPKVQERVERP